MNENETPIFDFAVEVVLALGFEWKMSLESNPWPKERAYLEGPNGATLYLRGDNWNNWGKSDRVLVSACWPKATNEHDITEEFAPYKESHEITCARSRGAQAVANDIRRRLLPTFLPRWDDKCELRDRWLEKEAIKAEAARLLREAMTGETANWHNSRDYHKIHKSGRNGGNGVSGSAEVSTYVFRGIHEDNHATAVEECEVTLELRNIPLDKALEVAKLLWPD